MKTQPYVSCNCRYCRGGCRKCFAFQKRRSHRVFRRKTRQALLTGREVPYKVSTGYRV